MSCYCDTGPTPELYQARRQRARKVHHCDECGKPIVIGECYERVAAKWEGQFQVLCTCPDCLGLRDAFEEMECFCWLHHSLLDDIEDQLREAYFYPGERFGYLRLLAKHRAHR